VEKVIIYHIFTRLYANRNTTRKPSGTLAENGCGKMNDFDDETLKLFRDRGISHVWYTGLLRHATQTDYSDHGIPKNHPAIVKGKAGSPYAITDYYDVDPDLATDVDKRMKEFDALVKRTHKAGLKMIIDFVPNHVARQYRSICKPRGVKDLGANDDPNMGFSPQNNFYYCPGCQFQPYFDLYHGESEPYTEMPAKATGNDHFGPCPGQNDWYETVKLNYGVDYYAGRVGHFDPMPDTWKKMTDILLFWAKRGVDGFRCDMAEMVPAEFWHHATTEVKSRYPNVVFIGEVYNPAEYRNYIAAGFDYLYDKVGMYDTMRAVMCGQRNASDITAAWQATDDIRDHMLYFLENHDEQRIASDFFAGDARKGVPALVASVLMQQNPFMLYAGQEYGERGMDSEGFSGHDGRTTIFDYWCVDTLCRSLEGKLTAEEKHLATLYQQVLRIARKEKAVSDGQFFDLMYVNPQSYRFNPNKQYAFLRKSDKEMLLVVVNFDDEAVHTDILIPAHAFDFLKIEQKRCTATDLLTGETTRVELIPDGYVSIDIPAHGAKVLKMKC